MQTLDISQNHEAWEKYLEELNVPQVQTVHCLWMALAWLIPAIRIPVAGTFGTDSYYFGWDDGAHLVEVEITQDNKLEWFFRNRTTEELAGSEEAVADLPDELLSYLERYACDVTNTTANLT